MLDLIVLALATWRLAYALTKEPGPYQLFERTRKVRFLSNVLKCIHCVSIYTAAFCWLLTFTPLWFVVWLLAASGLALMLHRYTGFYVD